MFSTIEILKRGFLLLAAVIAAFGMALPATAQNTAPPAASQVKPLPAPAIDGGKLQAAPPPALRLPPGDVPVDFVLDAKLIQGGPSVTSGVVWRVYAEALDPAGRLPLLAEVPGGAIKVKLKPGGYFVHAAYGRAGATKHINVPGDTGRDSLVLNAGGLRLSALVGKDTPLAKNLVSFDVYSEGDEESDRTLIVGNAQAGGILRLTAGTYNVVSRYGDANAVVRADIVVTAGKLTEATIFQRAARVTLKLVAEKGGEALANTAWSVVTPGGESVFESVGAFPTVVLAAGDYAAIAKHNGKIYENNFTVQSDLNRDIEVLGK